MVVFATVGLFWAAVGRSKDETRWGAWCGPTRRWCGSTWCWCAPTATRQFCSISGGNHGYECLEAIFENGRKNIVHAKNYIHLLDLNMIKMITLKSLDWLDKWKNWGEDRREVIKGGESYSCCQRWQRATQMFDKCLLSKAEKNSDIWKNSDYLRRVMLFLPKMAKSDWVNCGKGVQWQNLLQSFIW